MAEHIVLAAITTLCCVRGTGFCSSCKLANIVNSFTVTMASTNGRVKINMPPLGVRSSWQVQVCAAQHMRGTASSTAGTPELPKDICI